MVAFHALTKKQLSELRLTDISDGHLVLGNRDIPLAAPVRTRLAAWLDQRNRTWPGSANPHLLINRRTAPRLLPVSRQFPWTGLTLRPQALREDRILHEIHATGGDIRRICDLFGLSVEGATRYLNTVEHPDLTMPGERSVPPSESTKTARVGHTQVLAGAIGTHNAPKHLGRWATQIRVRVVWLWWEYPRRSTIALWHTRRARQVP
ncbi:hypothetical protein [Arthrobacter sp. U41]|uniref:hypothetical protein n=1 Tax=Arthrobacter sp. U41 TaxID=1849032 RepID=UPI000A7498D1|nr:hypothetical protein [Arthrobacter sp. U41]